MLPFDHHQMLLLPLFHLANVPWVLYFMGPVVPSQATLAAYLLPPCSVPAMLQAHVADVRLCCFAVSTQGTGDSVHWIVGYNCPAYSACLVLVLTSPQGTGDSVHWIFKNKDHGKTSATASLGLVTLWDVEGGLPQIDKWVAIQAWLACNGLESDGLV
jgi:hypothetical protein